MSPSLEHVHWWAVLVCIVVGQIFLTLWFAVLFARPWAEAYGVDDPKQHTREIPGATYAVGLACTVVLTLGLATTQASFGVHGILDGVTTGLWIAVAFCVATAMPGYAFLHRWKAFALAIGAQAILIVVSSTILAAWR